MTVETIEFSEATKAFDFLRELALMPNNNFYFRGHREESWRLQTTYQRLKPNVVSPDMMDLHEMVDYFIGTLLSAGKSLPFDKHDLRGKLEFARHYGLPTPLLDWSISPYVAMFFAFNGTRPEKAKRAVVNVLDIDGLAGIVGRISSNHADGTPGPDYMHYRNAFFEAPDFSEGYPGFNLSLMELPASWNTRMIRQMGLFLYDTWDYSAAGEGFRDLDDLIERTTETPGPNTGPTLRKVILPLTEGPKVFKLLEIAGITGIRLLDDYEGAIADAANAYNYNRKHGYFHDLQRRN